MKNQVKLEKKVMQFADDLNGKGYDLRDIMFAMFHRALTIFNLEEGHESTIVAFNEDKRITITHPMPGHMATIVPIPMPAGADEEERDIPMYAPLSNTRIHELLDYATCYGDFDENTPNGTPSSADVGNGMNDYRRAAIVLLKKVLGFLPEDFQIDLPDLAAGVQADVLRQAGAQFVEYAHQHIAKNTPTSDEKARVNVEMAVLCYSAVGEAPDMPEIPPREAQEADSGLGVSVDTPSLADSPSRADLLAWIDMKVEGCKKHGMDDAASVLRAMRGDIAGKLEERPIEVLRAMREIAQWIGEINVKAGWWTDANLDLRTAPYASHVFGTKMMLVVTEVSEAMEGHRKSKKDAILMDDHLPDHPMVAVEIADAMVRLFDLCANYRLPDGSQIDVAQAFVDKIAYNQVRADHKPEARAAAGGKSV